MKINLTRKQAEELIELSLSELKSKGHNIFLYQAVESMALSVGMVKDESKLDEWMEKYLK